MHVCTLPGAFSRQALGSVSGDAGASVSSVLVIVIAVVATLLCAAGLVAVLCVLRRCRREKQRSPRLNNEITCGAERQVRVVDANIIVFDGMSIDANREGMGVAPNGVRAVSTSSRQPRRFSRHSSRSPSGGFPRPSALRDHGRPAGPSQQLVVFE